MADQIAEANVDGAQLQECPALYELVVQLLSPQQHEPAGQDEAQVHGAGAEGCNAELASAPSQRDVGEGHFEDERGGKGEEGEPIGLTPYKKDRRATLREAAGYYRENEGSESRFSPIITSDYFGDSSNENEKVRLNFTY